MSRWSALPRGTGRLVLIVALFAVLVVGVFILILSQLPRQETVDPQVVLLQTQVAQFATQNALLLQGATTSQATLIQPAGGNELVVTATAAPAILTPIIVTATPQQVNDGPPVIIVTSTSTEQTVMSLQSTSLPQVNDSPGDFPVAPANPETANMGRVAFDVEPPPGYQPFSCFRVWQALDGTNLAWVSMFCNYQTSNPPPSIQMFRPTEFIVMGNGAVRFELWRDRGASRAVSPDPYEVANVTNSSLGLAWFAQGDNGQICVNRDCRTLASGTTYQLNFPQDFAGFYDVYVAVYQTGNVRFWQGERTHTQDTWSVLQ
jgi:hypothetical protein